MTKKKGTGKESGEVKNGAVGICQTKKEGGSRS